MARPLATGMVWLVVAISLALPGATLLTLDNLRPLVPDLERSAQVSVMLAEELNRKQAETFAKTGGLSKSDKRRGFEIAVTATGPHVVKKWLKNSEIHGVPRKQGDVKVTWEHMRDGGISTWCYDIGKKKIAS